MDSALAYNPESASPSDSLGEATPIDMKPLSAAMGELKIKGTQCCYICGGDHYSLGSVPKYGQVCPKLVICCVLCGVEMKNDLQCPRCNCEMPGELFPKQCDHCWMSALDHKPESCPNKGAFYIIQPKYIVTDEVLAHVCSPSWQPSSP